MKQQPRIVKKSPFADELTRAATAQLHERISKTAIELVPIASLKSNPRNAKQHPEKQVQLLAENIRKFGPTAPILIDEQGMILAGHGRIDAAKRLGLEIFPAVRLAHLSAQEKRTVALADNKLSELAPWDVEMLKAELSELVTNAADLAFDYSITGFDTVDIDRVLGSDHAPEGRDRADDLPELAEQRAVTKDGDLWRCGSHLVYCGNALDPSSYRVVLAGSRAEMVFTDPPYNVPNNGHVSKRANVREFAMASGDLTSEEFTDFLQATCGRLAANVADGAVIYVCMDWRHLDNLSSAALPYFARPKNLIVWVKANGGQGTFYRSQHELIAVYVAGHKSPINNFRLGERGRYRTNVWQYPGFNSFGRDRDALLDAHPTVKPVALVVDALRDCSKRGDVVLDPFGGSGTTMIAAERTGRIARVIEIDPIYCDVIVRRWQVFSGKEARHAETNETFAEVQSRRERTHVEGE